LKVWLGLRSIGRAGYVRALEDNIALSKRLYDAASRHPDLEPMTQDLSITTFRYRPADLEVADTSTEKYLNELNDELLTRLNKSGEAFLSNAVLNGAYVLRACVVNFRTSAADIEAIPGIIARHGSEVDREIRPDDLR